MFFLVENLSESLLPKNAHGSPNSNTAAYTIVLIGHFISCKIVKWNLLNAKKVVIKDMLGLCDNAWFPW